MLPSGEVNHILKRTAKGRNPNLIIWVTKNGSEKKKRKEIGGRDGKYSLYNNFTLAGVEFNGRMAMSVSGSNNQRLTSFLPAVHKASNLFKSFLLKNIF
jgi:hypothetical protein